MYQEEAPKVYEPGGSLVQIRERVEYFAAKYVLLDNIQYKSLFFDPLMSKG
jgi:hypothetical protein